MLGQNAIRICFAIASITSIGIEESTQFCSHPENILDAVRRWEKISVFTRRNGILHSFDDKPAVSPHNGNQEWWFNGKRHRDNDLPSIIMKDGTKMWFFDDKLHREKLPAIIFSNGTKIWYTHGRMTGMEIIGPEKEL